MTVIETPFVEVSPRAKLIFPEHFKTTCKTINPTYFHIRVEWTRHFFDQSGKRNTTTIANQLEKSYQHSSQLLHGGNYTCRLVDQHTTTQIFYSPESAAQEIIVRRKYDLLSYFHKFY